MRLRERTRHERPLFHVNNSRANSKIAMDAIIAFKHSKNAVLPYLHTFPHSCSGNSSNIQKTYCAVNSQMPTTLFYNCKYFAIFALAHLSFHSFNHLLMYFTFGIILKLRHNVQTETLILFSV